MSNHNRIKTFLIARALRDAAGELAGERYCVRRLYYKALPFLCERLGGTAPGLYRDVLDVARDIAWDLPGLSRENP
jgi:hypothetical protein